MHFAVQNYSNSLITSELLKAYPDAFFLDDAATKAVRSKCLAVLSQAHDLPCSIINNSMHPLRACIMLSAELTQFSRSQRSMDIRLANDADEKAAVLEQLACAIARCSEDTRGFGQEMDDCLQLAANSKLKFFISEPVCSRRIEELWWMTGSVAMSDTFGLLFASFIWISGLNFIVNFRGSQPHPLVRFLVNRASYFAFLVCLLQLPLLTAPGDPVNNLGLEVFLAYWLFDICFSEAGEFLDIMRKNHLTVSKAVAKYAEDSWNVYDVIALGAAVAAAVVRGLAHAGVEHVCTAASNQLYAWALALLWGRLVNVLYVVPFVGPLLIMVLAMVFRDLSKFVFLVVLMELPFVAALYFLESGDGGNEAFATFLDSALSFFKIVIGQGPDISSVTASSSVLLSFGSVLLSVLLLNLLIAMFSKTFDAIVENSTQEYLLRKAELTFAWMRAPRMPPPLSFSLVVRDWGMNMVARHVWRNETFRECCAGWEGNGEEHVEHPPSTFDKEHFYAIVLPRISKKPFLFPEGTKHDKWIRRWNEDFDAKYEAWCKQVLADLEENADFNSEAQMDKFKSHMLRGMETTVESSEKIKLQMAQNARATQVLSEAVQSHATQEQVKALSDAVQSQHAQIQQIHASLQLILKKLDP
jgi:hypothetical protein